MAWLLVRRFAHRGGAASLEGYWHRGRPSLDRWRCYVRALPWWAYALAWAVCAFMLSRWRISLWIKVPAYVLLIAGFPDSPGEIFSYRRYLRRWNDANADPIAQAASPGASRDAGGAARPE